MRYAGNITITDEAGAIVFERELDADNLIEELLNSRQGKNITSVLINEPAPSPVEKGTRKKTTCGTCHKEGHTTRTCPKNSTEPVKETRTVDDILTERQFKDIKDSVKHDMNALEIANEMNVPIAEVNSAISARDYDWYRKHI